MAEGQGVNTSLMINKCTAGTFLVINSQLGPQVNISLHPVKSIQQGEGSVDSQPPPSKAFPKRLGRVLPSIDKMLWLSLQGPKTVHRSPVIWKSSVRILQEDGPAS